MSTRSTRSMVRDALSSGECLRLSQAQHGSRHCGEEPQPAIIIPAQQMTETIEGELLALMVGAATNPSSDAISCRRMRAEIGGNQVGSQARSAA